MSLLRDEPDSLDALVAATGDSLRIDQAFVEKDFWVIEVLRAATSPVQVTARDGNSYDVETVFKGGTSLSRAYGLIERFSEDVDLLVSFPDVDPSIRARDNTLKAIRDAVSAHLGIEFIAGPATTGLKRNVRYSYPSRQDSTAVTQGILLEMGSRGGAHPTTQHNLRSLIADHAINNLGEDEHVWDEFEAVTVSVLAPERTLLEKLALLHDAASRYPDEEARLRLLKVGRHLYDVHRLLSSEDVLTALRTHGQDGVAALWADIDDHSRDAGFNFTPVPVNGFASSPLLDAAASCQAVARVGYASAMELVYGTQPSFDACMETIRTNAELLG